MVAFGKFSVYSGLTSDTSLARFDILEYLAADSRNRQHCGFFVCAPINGGLDVGAQARRFRSARFTVCQPVQAATLLDIKVAASKTEPLGRIMASTSNVDQSIDQFIPTEITIKIYQDDYCMYLGTREQLEDEGVIPASIKWPEGRKSISWVANGTNFSLYRTRPKDMKGPARLWINGDYWRLYVKSSTLNEMQKMAIRHQKSANNIKKMMTPQGYKEALAMSQKYYVAQRDEDFLKFKMALGI